MEKMIFLFKTDNNTAGLISRITLALILLPHGMQYTLGWFGGPGFAGTMEYLQQYEKLPWLIAFMVILLQTAGAALILLGAGGRLLAISMTLLFTGMIVTSHVEHGFFMNWTGNQKGEGYEYHLLAIGLCLVILFQGSGKFSIDSWLSRKMKLAQA